VYWLKHVATPRVIRHALAVMLVSLAGPVLGESPIVTLEPGAPVNVEKLVRLIEIYEDPERGLDINAVHTLAPEVGFQVATPAAANVGFSRSAWWVRLTLDNAGAIDRLVYLRQDYPLIDSLELYTPEPSGGWHKFATGDRQPFDSRPVAHRDFLFPLTIPANEMRTYYLRYVSQGPVDINLSLLDPNELVAAVSGEQLAYGTYFGCVFMLLVWSGLVFIAVRDQAFLAYFAYVATFGLYMSVNTGFAYQYLWPDSPRWANTCLIVLLNASMITALQFSITILRARDFTPKLEKIARVLQLLGLAAIAMIPLMEYAVLVKPVTFLVLVSVVFMIALGILNLLAGSQVAKFYVVAWGSFLAGSMIFLLKNFGLVPHSFFTQHSWQVGALFEMILLSMTLSSRMNELKHQSRTDPLTLLGNRRMFDDIFPKEFAHALEEGRPVALLMLDIDRFKAYNDRHGHAQGDEAIKLVGTALRRHARKPFIACRYGGEEFCVILPDTTPTAAAAVAERLRSAVQGAVSGELGITISIGYASVEDGEFDSHEKLFGAADEALYSAKEKGRNRVVQYRAPAREPAAAAPDINPPRS
jgi:two-component system, sensor histidine kinase LadS